MKHFLRNVVTVPKGSWIIQGLRGAQAEVEAYGDIIFEVIVNNQKRVEIYKRVLFAPDTGISLISIGQVTALARFVSLKKEE